MESQDFAIANSGLGNISPATEFEPELYDAAIWPALPANADGQPHMPLLLSRVSSKSVRPALRLVSLLDLLLVPDVRECGGAATKVWRDYSSHLALKLMQLYLTRQLAAKTTNAILDRRSRQFSNLSTLLKPIIQPQLNYLVPLDYTLGNIAVALCELFPLPHGSIRLFTEGLSLKLPGTHHRVVAAVGIELLLNALQHGFFSGSSGDVYIVAGSDARHAGFLLVADNGKGVGCSSPGEGSQLISRLAGLIGGETILRNTGKKGTQVEARFHLPEK